MRKEWNTGKVRVLVFLPTDAHRKGAKRQKVYSAGWAMSRSSRTVKHWLRRGELQLAIATECSHPLLGGSILSSSNLLSRSKADSYPALILLLSTCRAYRHQSARLTHRIRPINCSSDDFIRVALSHAALALALDDMRQVSNR